MYFFVNGNLKIIMKAIGHMWELVTSLFEDVIWVNKRSETIGEFLIATSLEGMENKCFLLEKVVKR